MFAPHGGLPGANRPQSGCRSSHSRLSMRSAVDRWPRPDCVLRAQLLEVRCRHQEIRAIAVFSLVLDPAGRPQLEVILVRLQPLPSCARCVVGAALQCRWGCGPLLQRQYVAVFASVVIRVRGVADQVGSRSSHVRPAADFACECVAVPRSSCHISCLRLSPKPSG